MSTAPEPTQPTGVLSETDEECPACLKEYLSKEAFFYKIGEEVIWIEEPELSYVVGQRRWTERALDETFVEYRLRRVENGRTRELDKRWIRQADLGGWCEEHRPKQAYIPR